MQKNAIGGVNSSVEFVCDSAIANSLCNTLRQVAMTQRSCLRPIAFQIGSRSTVTDAGDEVEEAPLEVIWAVSSLRFRYAGSRDLAFVTFSTDSVLKAKDLEANGISVISEDKEILHAMSATSGTIYFRFAKGMFSAKDNQEFLRANDVDMTKVTCIASNHNELAAFNVNREELQNGKAKVEISVSSDSEVFDSADFAKTILIDAINRTVQELDEIKTAVQ